MNNENYLNNRIFLYTKEIYKNPKNGDAYYSRGNAKSDLKDYAGAIADYNKAIELNPNDAEVYYNRAEAKNELGDIEGYNHDMEQYEELINKN